MPDFADTRLARQGGFTVGIVNSTITAAKTVNVTVGGLAVDCRVLRDVTLAVGDRCLIAKDGINRWVVGRLFAAAVTGVSDETNDPVPVVKIAVVKGTTSFAPVETRSYRTSYGWRSDNSDVYQGQYGGYGNHTGCAFYGRGPAALKGATVLSATIKVRRVSGGVFGSQGTTLRLITQKTRPGGAPSVTGSSSGPSLAVGGSTTFTVPPSFAQAIVDGTSGGLGIYDSGGSPYVRLAGKGSYSPSFTLTIKWQR